MTQFLRLLKYLGDMVDDKLTFYNDSISPVTKMRRTLVVVLVSFTMTQFLRLLKCDYLWSEIR